MAPLILCLVVLGTVVGFYFVISHCNEDNCVCRKKLQLVRKGDPVYTRYGKAQRYWVVRECPKHPDCQKKIRSFWHLVPHRFQYHRNGDGWQYLGLLEKPSEPRFKLSDHFR
jgi:hypothetical protein